MTTQCSDATVKEELHRLTAGFFRAVTFDEGEEPSYDDIYALFIESGLLIKNTGAAPEISTVREFIEPRAAVTTSRPDCCIAQHAPRPVADFYTGRHSAARW